ncbi:MAG: T9SS type A sorting domain-containing protein [Bacteroidetes bacterium]|nr:T9SS type A sorting domain-containing protein [Bacteroidota bacterium]
MGSDGAGITDVNFVDPDTNETALVNLIASTDTPDFTSGDGVRFSFDGEDVDAPLEVVFTLTVDEPEGLAPGDTFTASYFAKVINACEVTLDVDPVQTLNASPSPVVQLQGNYPNPFTDATTLRFALPEATDVRLVVFDLLGREVAVLVEEMLPAGTYEVPWDGTLHGGHAAASGVYIVRLEAGAVHTTQRILRTR